MTHTIFQVNGPPVETPGAPMSAKEEVLEPILAGLRLGGAYLYVRAYWRPITSMYAGAEDNAQPGWTTSRRGQDSPWKSQSAVRFTKYLKIYYTIMAEMRHSYDRRQI